MISSTLVVKETVLWYVYMIYIHLSLLNVPDKHSMLLMLLYSHPFMFALDIHYKETRILNSLTNSTKSYERKPFPQP